MRACCAILILVPLALRASVEKSESRVQNLEFPPTNLVSRTEPGTQSPEPGWNPVPFSHFEGILTRMPFGQPPPPPPPPPPPVALRPPPIPIAAAQLTLCAINRTLAGTVAVGIVDGSVTPPHNYYLGVGETDNGVTVVKADFDLELAVIEKDHFPVTLHLNAGPRVGGNPTVASAGNAASTAAVTADLASVAPVAETEPHPGPAFATCTEQLLSMVLSMPAGVRCPPLPYVGGSEEDIQQALNHVIVIEAHDTEDVAALKENVGLAKEELRSHLQNGGDLMSYLQALNDRHEAEKPRQEAAHDTSDADS